MPAQLNPPGRFWHCRQVSLATGRSGGSHGRGCGAHGPTGAPRAAEPVFCVFHPCLHPCPLPVPYALAVSASPASTKMPSPHMLLVHKAHDHVSQRRQALVDGSGLLDALALRAARLLPLAACTRRRQAEGLGWGLQNAASLRVHTCKQQTVIPHQANQGQDCGKPEQRHSISSPAKSTRCSRAVRTWVAP